MASSYDAPPFAQLYPPFKPRKHTRELTYSVVRNDGDGNMYITDENGVMECVEYGESFYQSIKEYALQGNVMLWRTMSDGDALDEIIHNALDDKSARVLVTKRGVSGVCWIAKRGKKWLQHSGAILSGACWNLETEDDSEYLRAIRRFSTHMGIGDYFSLSALGSAHLTKYWYEHGIKRERTTPERMRRSMARYTVGGRSETLVGTAETIDTASELDLKSAYTTAAKLLPMGRRVFIPASVEIWSKDVQARYSAIYGKWHIVYNRTLICSPIPARADNFTDTKSEYQLQWTVNEGSSYDYDGWAFEIKALLQTGAASVTWMGGYGWCTLSDALAGWVDGLWQMRDTYKTLGDTQLELFAKMLGNAVIGRMGMTCSTRIVTRREAQDGDKLWIPRGANGWVRDWGSASDDTTNDGMDYVSGSLFIHSDTDTPPRLATPVHLLSYIQAATRMEEWRQLHAQQEAGHRVIATNVDSCWIDGEGVAIESEKITPHAWRWAVKSRRSVRVVYNRGFVYLNMDTQCMESKLPGVPRKLAQARINGVLRELSRVDYMEKVEHEKRKKANAQTAYMR